LHRQNALARDSREDSQSAHDAQQSFRSAGSIAGETPPISGASTDKADYGLFNRTTTDLASDNRLKSDTMPLLKREGERT